MKELIDKLRHDTFLSREEFRTLIQGSDESSDAYLFEQARAVSVSVFGNKVYTRGLIEFSNYCKNDCYYCGIRCSNRKADRYRLTKEEILDCCREGHELGFRTFVLQSGEDPYYTDERFTEIISEIRRQYPDCAITLSVGERDSAAYQSFFDAGANRFLLRHETADAVHYAKLHPPGLTAEHRQECLRELRRIGYQVGTGFMVGSPYQTADHLVDDLSFIKELDPHMVGIGPFISHQDTPFADQENGTLKLTLRLVAILRLMLPTALLPATTALGTIDPNGREKGILAGANVVMPNLSPVRVREKYALYDNKICTGDEAAHCRSCLQGRMQRIGYEIVTARGDHGDIQPDGQGFNRKPEQQGKT